jgi:molecular chaperone DnaK (HSP70)
MMLLLVSLLIFQFINFLFFLCRLRKECEDAMKILSTGAEATIDIDSLYEGVDYSAKVTRARFEDLISIPLIQVI